MKTTLIALSIALMGAATTASAATIHQPLAAVIYMPLAAAHTKQIPATHKVVKVGEKTYFVSQGVYYERRGRNYVVVKAPVGLRVAALPAGYVVKRVGPRRYYFVGGTYYVKRGNQFEVVRVSVS